jgi:hypothetical protein
MTNSSSSLYTKKGASQRLSEARDYADLYAATVPLQAGSRRDVGIIRRSALCALCRRRHKAHFLRDCFGHARKDQHGLLGALIRPIFAADSLHDARDRLSDSDLIQ